MSDTVDFNLERRLKAPQEKVWKAWTDEDALRQWFGPAHCPVFAVKLDLRVGGMFHYGMKTPDGGEMWGKWIFREIKSPEHMVTIVNFSDKEGGVTRHPWNALWPLSTFSEMTLKADGVETLLTIRWRPENARPDEVKAFAENHASMQEGWGGTMAQLEAYLAR